MPSIIADIVFGLSTCPSRRPNTGAIRPHLRPKRTIYAAMSRDIDPASGTFSPHRADYLSSPTSPALPPRQVSTHQPSSSPALKRQIFDDDRPTSRTQLPDLAASSPPLFSSRNQSPRHRTPSSPVDSLVLIGHRPKSAMRKSRRTVTGDADTMPNVGP